MDNIIKKISKCIILSVIISIIFILIGFIIVKYKNYNLKDVLFIEGILLVVLGFISSIGGNPMGASIQSIGQSNAQYRSNINLEISRIEKERTKDTLKNIISIGLSTVSLVISGAICVIIAFFI